MKHYLVRVVIGSAVAEYGHLCVPYQALQIPLHVLGLGSGLSWVGSRLVQPRARVRARLGAFKFRMGWRMGGQDGVRVKG